MVVFAGDVDAILLLTVDLDRLTLFSLQSAITQLDELLVNRRYDHVADCVLALVNFVLVGIEKEMTPDHVDIVIPVAPLWRSVVFLGLELKTLRYLAHGPMIHNTAQGGKSGLLAFKTCNEHAVDLGNCAC